MVVGYECPDCGFQHECGVSKSGERLCPDCETAVTGITTYNGMSHRFEAQEAVVVTISRVGARDRHVTVSAYDYESAWEAANEQMDDEEYVTDITSKQEVYHR